MCLALAAVGREFFACTELRAIPEEYIVQMVVNSADKTVPSILDNHLPVLWNRENVIGILKHSFAFHYLDAYNKACDDDRIETKARYLPSKEKWYPGDPLKESSRYDAIAKERKIIFDYKFGMQGVTQAETDGILRNAPSGISTVKEVRPSTADSVLNQKDFFGSK